MTPQAPGLANVPSGWRRNHSGWFSCSTRTPAGVIDDDVQKNPAAAQVRLVGQFAELVNAGRALVENHQRRINGRQVQRGIRAAEPPEARVGRRAWD